MTTDYEVEELAEMAAQAVVRAAEIDWLQPLTEDGTDRVYVGLEGRETADTVSQEETAVLPCVICSCDQSEPVLPNYHGNWNVRLTVEIRSNADDTTGPQHAARAKQVGDLFLLRNITAYLHLGAPGLFVHKVVPGPRSRRIVDRSWVSVREFTLLSCYTFTQAAIDS